MRKKSEYAAIEALEAMAGDPMERTIGRVRAAITANEDIVVAVPERSDVPQMWYEIVDRLRHELGMVRVTVAGLNQSKEGTIVFANGRSAKVMVRAALPWHLRGRHVRVVCHGFVPNEILAADIEFAETGLA